MVPALADGFATATTDGGHSSDTTSDASAWALTSPGNVNWPLLVDFASVAIHDMAVIGKAITESFFGMPPQHSYFHGASTGGRQGLMLAQRYPKDFDGIIAICPAINWVEFIVANLWPQFIMNQLHEYPRGCELDAITEAAISACDSLDGVTDGIISLPALCDFNPQTLVGKSFHCNGIASVFTSAAAAVADAAWSGPRSSSGGFQWFGIGRDAELGSSGIGIATTTCEEDGTCKGYPFPISLDWIKLWLVKDFNFDFSTITHNQWDALFHTSINEYDSIIGTSDSDLSEFRRAGGKTLTWHGL